MTMLTWLENLADGAGELAGHVQEGDDDADAEGHAGDADIIRRPKASARPPTSATRTYMMLPMLLSAAASGVGKPVAVAGIVIDFAIDLVKIGLCPFFVGRRP